VCLAENVLRFAGGSPRHRDINCPRGTMAQQLFDQTVIGSCELQSGAPAPCRPAESADARNLNVREGTSKSCAPNIAGLRASASAKLKGGFGTC